MVGMAYAAVPLYDWFCRTTGFGGTPHGRDGGARRSVLDRKIIVRFDANVGAGPAVALRAGADLDRGQARRGR